MSLATSGNYLNYKTLDSEVVGHILDPRTLSPIDHELVSVTILATTCTEADAIATGLFVMGPKEALAWLDNHDYPALLIVDNNGIFENVMMNDFDRFVNP